MKARTKKGFTLVEVIIACTLLAVVLLGLGQSIIVAQRQTAALEQEFAILCGCEEVMGNLLKLPFESLLKQNGTKFALKLSHDEKQEVSGRIEVGEDLNGNGKIEKEAPYYEGSGDAVYIKLFFRERLILRRIVCRFYGATTQ
ncbi:MAG: prepilin-type N-terminal cleavage/methylation domain-containing protein [Planctomycetota bacterium]|nr:prepilin-type N-terminal cleavage/methylation domain-containing protein [Planctomycetota bacterium]